MTTFSDATMAGFLHALADKSPVPGGGAAAAASGALGIALAAMVLRYSIGKKALAEHQPTLTAALDRAERLGASFAALADEDARAYAPLNDAFRLPEPQRAPAIAAAARGAIEPPRAVLRAAREGLELVLTLPDITNRQLHSDLAIAAIALESAARASRWNIEVNLPLLEDASAREGIAGEASDASRACGLACAAIESACRRT